MLMPVAECLPVLIAYETYADMMYADYEKLVILVQNLRKAAIVC